jgi:hypothetical protein
MNHPLIIKVRYGLVALTTTWFLSALVALSNAGLDMRAYVIHFYAALALSVGWTFCLITSRRGSHPLSARLSLVALPAAVVVVYLLSTIDPPRGDRCLPIPEGLSSFEPRLWQRSPERDCGPPPGQPSVLPTGLES